MCGLSVLCVLGGSRPLLLVYLPVVGVLRFRERASVVVAGFGKGGLVGV